MLKLINEKGDVLILPDDQVVGMEKLNPLFNDPEKFIQDASYKFNVPFSQYSDIFFSMGKLIESSSSDFTMSNVRFYAWNTLMCACDLQYSISATGYEPTLKPNLTALIYLMKNIFLNEIRTLDPDVSSGDTEAKFKALMLDTCRHPEKYNYIFLPIENHGFGEEGFTTYNWMNFFSVADQEFKVRLTPTSGGARVANAPFFKLKYILKVISEYLGLRPEGDVFQTSDYDDIYIYSPLVFDVGRIYPSMRYMPKMLIADFWKLIRDGLHFIFDINLAEGVLNLTSFRDLYYSNEALDLTFYLSPGVLQERTEEKGYNISRKSDATDQAFAVQVGDNTEYPPLYNLIVGDGSTSVELDCGTLMEKQEDSGWKHLIVDQPLYSPGIFGEKTEEFPIRLFRYLGYNEQAPGVFVPESEAINFDDSDKLYWRFRNDCKRVTLPGNFPPSLLASLKTTQKICYRSEGLNYTYLIIEKIVYNAGGNKKLIPGTIYARALNFDATTNIQIIKNKQFEVEEEVGRVIMNFRAYFDYAIHGFEKLSFEILTTSPGSGRLYKADDITNPTNYKGTGGLTTAGYVIAGAGQDFNVEIRIKTGKPLFIERLGERTYFSQTPDYFTATIPAVSTRLDDFNWICFGS